MSQSIFSLEGKVALITGGNRGLGLTLARGFISAGAQVAVTGRDVARNHAAAAELGAGAAVIPMDVRSEQEVERAVARVVEHFGRLDILINNAGIVRVGLVLDSDRQSYWDEVIESNLTGPYLCARYAAQAMISGGRGGKIINIGSIVANVGPTDFASYAASKSGLVGLTNALVVELAPYNIQVNLIEPGYFDTEISQGVPAHLREQMIRKTPAGRWGRPEELIGAAVFLASDASSYVNGARLRVDGGYLVQERLRQE